MGLGLFTTFAFAHLIALSDSNFCSVGNQR